MRAKSIATIYAILAAALYAINVPLSKLLLNYVEPTMMASFLYLGAGFGLFLYGFVEKVTGKETNRESLTKKELPYTIAMVVLDIVAPILLMSGIAMTNSANVSLLNNFEIVATSIIALVIFKEVISRRLWIAILLVTIASVVLSFEGAGAFEFNGGSILVLGACLCWGLENNCTKMISNKSSVEIVVIKGTFSGLGSLLIAFIQGERIPAIQWIICVLILGFVAYGLSIHFYIMAQKELGAAKTSAYYSIAPFLGVAFSMILLNERPSIQFYVGLFIMVISTYFMIKDTIELQHTHNGDIAMDLKAKGEQLKIDIPALFLALKDKETPIIAKVFAGLTVAYALSPIDLVPDFIPVFGYLDDLILLPMLVALTIKFIPKEVFEQKRKQAVGMWEDGKPKKWYYVIPIVVIWILIIFLIIKAII